MVLEEYLVKEDRAEPTTDFKKQPVSLESHKRSIIKAITWRIIALIVTLLVSYIWLGEWGSSIALAITANGIKILLYYLHERGWNLLSWGRGVKTHSMEEN